MLKLQCAQVPTDALIIHAEDAHVGVAIEGAEDLDNCGYVALNEGAADLAAAYLRAHVDQKRGTFTLTFTHEELDRLSAAFDAEDKDLFERIERVRAARGIELWAESDEPEDRP